MSAAAPSPLDAGRLRGRLAAGETTFGTFVGGGSALMAEVCAAAGADWLLLDLEHGGGGEEQVRDVVPAAASYGVPTVVRVETGDRIRVGRVLDAGAAGVMIPQVESLENARDSARALRYGPHGTRGIATYNRACRFGLDASALERADQEVLGIFQVETLGALREVDQIAALEGVDVLFVGPRDLSHALGVPGRTDDPVYCEAVGTVLAAAHLHGKTAGLLAPDGAAAARWAEEGWRFIAIGSDTTVLAAALQRELTTGRGGR